MNPYLELLRPHQWYKNVVAFLGIFFGGLLLNPGAWLQVLRVFIALCLISSSSYILNDLRDVEEDRKHPKKKNRPLASGRAKIFPAYLLSVLLFFLPLPLLSGLSWKIYTMVYGLFILTQMYTQFFKKIPLFDVAFLSLNFVLRTLAGVYALNIYISPWIILVPYFVGVYLALMKRRGELVRGGPRKSLKYDMELLDHLISGTIFTLLVLYVLYAFSKPSTSLYFLTLPFAVYILFRWFHLSRSDPDMAEEAQRVLKDPGILLSFLLWTLILLYIHYPQIFQLP